MEGMKRGLIKVEWRKLKDTKDIGLFANGLKPGMVRELTDCEWAAYIGYIPKDKAAIKTFPTQQAAKEAVEKAVNMHDNS